MTTYQTRQGPSGKRLTITVPASVAGYAASADDEGAGLTITDAGVFLPATLTRVSLTSAYWTLVGGRLKFIGTAPMSFWAVAAGYQVSATTAASAEGVAAGVYQNAPPDLTDVYNGGEWIYESTSDVTTAVLAPPKPITVAPDDLLAPAFRVYNQTVSGRPTVVFGCSLSLIPA